MTATTPQTFAEKKIDSLLAAWESARNPHDPAWRRQYAAAAIKAGLPCLDERGVKDLGPDGWRQWARENGSAA